MQFELLPLPSQSPAALADRSRLLDVRAIHSLARAGFYQARRQSCSRHLRAVCQGRNSLYPPTAPPQGPQTRCAKGVCVCACALATSGASFSPPLPGSGHTDPYEADGTQFLILISCGFLQARLPYRNWETRRHEYKERSFYSHCSEQ